MQPLTVTDLRKNLYTTIDDVITTGVPAKIKRKGKRLKIVLEDDVDRFAQLKPHGTIVGNPEELVNLHPYRWQEEKNL